MYSHLHFVVWAAMDQVGERFSGVTYIDLVADDMSVALEKAEELCPGRRYYWVNNIIEHHSVDSIFKCP
jgi:hypothetical protein